MSYQTPPMETPTPTLHQSPSIESFSYSWLVNLNPISAAVDDDDEASFIEMDPRLPPSRRFLRASSSSDLFNFDFPDVSPRGLVHADELISNGFLVVKDHGGAIETDGRDDSPSTHRCKKRAPRRRRLSMRLVKRYLKYLLRPLILYGRRRRRRGGEDDDDGDDDDDVRMKWELSAATVSPRTSLAYSSADDDWRRSCDSESSIYEAVLHCKRTHG